MFTYSGFPAYNCRISNGRQNTIPESNQTEFPQQNSLRKVILQKGEKKEWCHGYNILVPTANSNGFFQSFICALFFATNQDVMNLTFSENPLTGRMTSGALKFPTWNHNKNKQRHPFSHHCILFYIAQGLLHNHSKFCWINK